MTEVTEAKEPNYKLMPPWLRFALLKAEIRGISLEKEEAGYKSQYFLCVFTRHAKSIYNIRD